MITLNLGEKCFSGQFLNSFTSFFHTQVVINALFAAIPGIGNVLVVSLLFWLIFSILGVQLFSGKFQSCVDNDGKRLPASLVPNKTECLRFPEKYTWRNSDVNFDNVLNGFLTLFQVVSYMIHADPFFYRLVSEDKILSSFLT